MLARCFQVPDDFRVKDDVGAGAEKTPTDLGVSVFRRENRHQTQVPLDQHTGSLSRTLLSDDSMCSDLHELEQYIMHVQVACIMLGKTFPARCFEMKIP